MKNRPNLGPVAGLISIALLCGIIGRASVADSKLAQTQVRNTQTAVHQNHAIWRGIYERSKDAVVYVKVEMDAVSPNKPALFKKGIQLEFPFPLYKYSIPHPTEYVQNIQVGAGFILTPSGEILTNYHVIEGGSNISVRFEDGRFYTTSVIEIDPDYDLALLKIENAGLTIFSSLALGDSNAVNITDPILIIGHPFGLGWTPSEGMLSGLNRCRAPICFLQLQSAINPGNSGGPVLDINGSVIGIVQSIIPNGDGIGFAIPINTVKDRLPIMRSKKLPEKSSSR